MALGILAFLLLLAANAHYPCLLHNVLLAECARALIIFNECVVAIALLLQIRKQAMDSRESNKAVGDVDSDGLGVGESDQGEANINDRSSKCIC